MHIEEHTKEESGGDVESHIHVSSFCVAFSILRCPRCQRAIEAHLFFMNSGLGPSLLECPRCRHVFDGGRKEWAILGWPDRIAYVLFTIVYMGITGMLGVVGVILWTMVIADREMRKGWIPGALAAAGATLVFQMWRLAASRQRSASDKQAPYVAGFWSPHVNVHLKYLVVILVISFITTLCVLSQR
jgi:hypothetical protein